jgi:hypothetical protein
MYLAVLIRLFLFICGTEGKRRSRRLCQGDGLEEKQKAKQDPKKKARSVRMYLAALTRVFLFNCAVDKSAARLKSKCRE